MSRVVTTFEKNQIDAKRKSMYNRSKFVLNSHLELTGDQNYVQQLSIYSVDLAYLVLWIWLVLLIPILIHNTTNHNFDIASIMRIAIRIITVAENGCQHQLLLLYRLFGTRWSRQCWICCDFCQICWGFVSYRPADSPKPRGGDDAWPFWERPVPSRTIAVPGPQFERQYENI